ncbi:MAG: hypothetical protein F9B45_19435 [Phycisphaera sp. RhM]|nr:hypothetical protein [Phycisphaera sp. RhM]
MDTTDQLNIAAEERQQDNVHPWRLRLVVGWLAMTLSIAAYAILKPGTTAADLALLPNPIIAWLDANFNFRTFVMALGVCLVPACLLVSEVSDRRRRMLFAAVVTVLVGLEFMQLWIPTRGFSWPDVGYTFAGVGAAECFVLLARWIGAPSVPAADQSCSV